MPLPSSIATACLVAFGLAASVGADDVKVDDKLPEYKATTGVSGKIKCVSADVMRNELLLWGEGFTKFYPSVQFEVEGYGDGSAPAALINGTTDFAAMSRVMKAKEIDDFKAKYGYEPTKAATSFDTLAVYVSKDNPIKSLTFKQLDAVFSKTRKGGADKDVKTWGDLGLTGDWADKPISLYSRNSSSAAYGYFKEHALFNGDYKDEVKEQPGSSSVVQGVAKDKYGIGYSGIGYITADVRAVPLSEKDADKPVPAEPENAYIGSYPLARPLYIYVNYKPGSMLDPVRAEFLRYVLSKQGQVDVVKFGFLPIGEDIAGPARKAVGLEK